jgi:phosphohistidine phosphatase
MATVVRVILVHHGDALPAEVDAERPLSAHGARDVAALAAETARRGGHPEAVWHSGKRRARQTAEAFWRACNPLAEFSAVRGLQPGDPAQWMHDRLAGEARDILCVGHLPHIARLLRRLLGRDEEDSSVTIPLNGLVVLEGDGVRPWEERWRLDPRALAPSP